MKRVLIIGLGNPGAAYEATRHNLGVRAVRAWIHSASLDARWREDASLNAEIAEVVLGGVRVVCLFPLTFMNTSGEAVAAYLRNNEIDALLTVHDELELPLGEMNIKSGTSSSSHNGVRSVQDAIGVQEDTARLRLGIDRPSDGLEVKAYVLQKFSPEEEASVQEKVIPAAAEMIREWVEGVS